jgi:hypothetical protein
MCVRACMHAVVGNVERPSCSRAIKGAWFSVRLPPGLWLVPSRYSLRHGHGTPSHSLRNWDLLGSSDGDNWQVLRSHVDDHSLDGRFAASTWSVGQSGPLRAFRVQMTGPNSSHDWELRVRRRSLEVSALGMRGLVPERLVCLRMCVPLCKGSSHSAKLVRMLHLHDVQLL